MDEAPLHKRFFVQHSQKTNPRWNSSASFSLRSAPKGAGRGIVGKACTRLWGRIGSDASGNNGRTREWREGQLSNQLLFTSPVLYGLIYPVQDAGNQAEYYPSNRPLI